jgi:hypothetical protein
MFHDGDLDGAVELATRGLDDDDPASAALAAMVLVAAHLAAGRDADAIAVVPDMRAKLHTAKSLTRFWLAFGVAQSTHADAEADAGADIQALIDAATALGGPSELAHAVRMRSQYRLGEGDPEGAIADAYEAVRLNASVGTPEVWSEVTLAGALVLGRHPDARRELRRIIAAAHDDRQWAAIDTLLELPARVLTPNDPTSIAVVSGHVERRDPPWGRFGREIRRRTAHLVEAIPDAAAHQARGAAMDRYEIVAFTLDALAEP